MTASDGRFEVKINERTHLVIESGTGRCLGAAGANFYRPWAFPLYTPSGLTVVREFPYEHPFHTGVFVGQHPVRVGGRVGNFWVAPPVRSFDDPLAADLGRVDSAGGPEVAIDQDAVRFTFRCVWRDAREQPMLDEVRTMTFRALPEATICDVASEKTASYGRAEFPQTKFGSIGLRVEPRLLPALGGEIIADGGRRGGAEVVHEGDSEFVAYENALAGAGRFGVLMHIMEPAVRGPWFIRDYGMALYNPTWTRPVATPAGGSWTIALRVAAYDGALTDGRVREWLK